MTEDRQQRRIANVRDFVYNFRFRKVGRIRRLLFGGIYFVYTEHGITEHWHEDDCEFMYGEPEWWQNWKRRRGIIEEGQTSS